MKKVALSLMALALVAAGAFADAPKWDPKVSTEFKGEATLTLGYDLDTGTSALKNGTSLSLIVDLVTGGDRSTTSDQDVWGEIKIKTDGDPVRIKADNLSPNPDDPKTAYDNGFKLQVDFATIHFGKAAYLKITSKDTKIGYANSPDLAFLSHVFSNVVSADTSAFPIVVVTSERYGKDLGTLHKTIESKGPVAAGGFEVGYSLEKVASIAVVAGTTDQWSTSFVNTRAKTNVAYKVTASLLAVDNLTVEAGYSSSTVENSIKALGGKVAYKYAIDGDKLFVKPSAGLTQVTPAGASAKAVNYASAGVLLGTGAKAKAFDNYGLALDSDYGSYPGVAVGVFYNDGDAVNELNNKKADLGLNVSVNSGSLIPDVTLVAAYDILDLNATDLVSNLTVGASTSIKSGDITIAPKGFVSYLSAKDSIWFFKDNGATVDLADSTLFAKATVDVTGVIPFVTFTLNYESNDLTSGYSVKNDKLGKVEFTTKVSF